MKKEYKELIPNILTFTRVVLTPIMIILSIFKCFKIVTILAIIGALTDMIDGKLARYWNTVSLKGAKLDAIADKIFGIGLIICLIPQNKSIIILLIMEILIALTNIYYHYKTNKTESLMIGKFKTAFLFVTIILTYLQILNNSFSMLADGFKVATINLQFLSLIFYFINYYNFIKINKPATEEKEIISEETIVLDNLVDLAKKYGTYDNEKDDIY